jgi:hypothetical protein
MLGFVLGVVMTFVGLALLGRLLRKTGPNSRVRQKENIVAVLAKGE